MDYTSAQPMSTDVSLLSNDDFNGSTIIPVMTANRSLANLIQDKMNTAQYFVCPTLFVLGIVGNILTILTVSQVQFQQMTSRFILLALAASDSLLLLTNPFNQQFMPAILGLDVRTLSSEGCKLFFVMYRVGKMSSSWFIVLVDIERFVAILFPLKVKRLITKTTILIAIAIIYVLMFTISGVWTISTGIVNGTCRADVVNADTLSVHKSFLIVGATCYSIAPMAILLTLTPLIVLNLYRSQRMRHNLQLQNIARTAKDTYRVTVMLVGIVITYIICVTPITLLLILTFWTNEPIYGSTKIEYIIFSGVASTFEQINHSSNFFVYVLCCRQFRQGFLHMVRCTRKNVTGTGSSINVSYIEKGLEVYDN
jgi:hypothetical protein